MDGNAQNMYHGGGGAGHQGDPYYRYDPSAPRGMGPPPGTPYGGTARHRAPHPMQQPQQSQYPGYQPTPTDQMYGMGSDQHPGMGSLGDLTGGWGAQPPPQANPYGTPMGYGHPQTPQQPQRQPQAQTSYRQHMAGYPQQDPQKMAYTQQSMMTGMGYGAIGQPQTQPSQQQAQQQRVPQHYGQTTSHMYPGAPQTQPTASQQYGYGMPGQMGGPGQASHVGYGHAQLDQTSYNRLMPNQPPAGHHHGVQQPPSQIPPHPTQQSQPHLTQGGQTHHSLASQPQPSQMHPMGQTHAGHPGLPSVTSQQSGPPQTSQNHLSTQSHLLPTSQPQQGGVGLPQQSTTHQMMHAGSGMVGMPHGMPSYQQPPTAPQQQSYVPNAKPPQQPGVVTQQHGNSPQYRPTYPQLSPGMSPRGPQQISPHPQMSPRPVMSPAKPPAATQSAPQMNAGIGSPRPQQAANKPTGPQNTLQALEQLVGPNSGGAMVGPGLEYNPQAAYRPPPHQMQSNPMSPMGPRLPTAPSQHQPWQPRPTPQPQSLNGNTPHHPQMQTLQPLPPQSMSTAQQQATPLPPVSEMLPQNQPTQPTSNLYSMESLTQSKPSASLQQTMQHSPLIDTSIMSPPPSLGQQQVTPVQQPPQIQQQQQQPPPQQQQQQPQQQPQPTPQQPPMIMTPPTVMEQKDDVMEEPLLETSGSTANSMVGSASSVAGSAGSETAAPSEEENEKDANNSEPENEPEKEVETENEQEDNVPEKEDDKSDLVEDHFEEKIEKQVEKEKIEETTTVEELTSTMEEPVESTQKLPTPAPILPQPVVQLQPVFGGMHYQSPLMHDAERAALQQQIQELCCVQASQEIQDKIKRLQERLNLLQQHETNDQCNGGPECILQTPFSAMIDSPQVSSTTGRGRSRTSNKPRKPRSKKDKTQAVIDDEVPTPVTAVPPANLPVSEDSVTAGTGDAEGDPDASMDATNESITDLDTSTDPSGKKIKKPRKPRVPRPDRPPKEPKERKKREPKDPSKQRKRGKKAASEVDESEQNQDSTQLSKSSMDENQSLASMMHTQNSSDANAAPTEVTDFDDIPVNKISKDAISDDGDMTKRSVESEAASEDDGSTPKKRRPYRKTDGSDRRRRANRGRGRVRPPGQRAPRRDRLQIIADSDDDMVGSPPPSPPMETEIDSSKRRSARNTCRKKYTDDVMLRFSDDEAAVVLPSPKKKEVKEGNIPTTAATEGGDDTQTENVTTSESAIPVAEEPLADVEKREEVLGKPNYVYINPSDEDQMVVQAVLAMRMGKRALLPDPPPPPPPPPVKEEPKSEADGEEKPLDEVKEEATTDETTEVKAEIDETEKDKEEEEKEKVEPMETDSTEESEEKKEDIAEKVEKEEEPTEKTESVKDEEEEKPEEEKSEEPAEEMKAEVEEEKVEEKVKEKVEEKPEPMETETSETETKPKVEETTEAAATDEKSEKDEKEIQYVEVEEYLVKYRNFSYLHCEWRTEEELLKGDKRVSNKIRRFQQKQAQQLNIFENIEDEPFNPDFIEVDRVLDVSEHVDDDGNKVKHYLVKWKSLAYEDSTWELEEDVDQIKIDQFERFTKIPPKSEWKLKKRPHPDMWKPLEKTPVYKGGNTLRAYQLEGLNWLKFSWYKGNNCILADEMGLGKTIQSLTFIHSVFEYGVRGPFLVIAPLSTIPNWQREFESWTELNVIVYHGSAMSRQMINDYELYYKTESGKVIKDITKFNVLITTFEMIVTDHQDLKNFNWRVCVIDEAHRLKNRNCKLLEGLRQLHLEHRVLLSGTPLQNNVNELFSLLNFLEPTQFASSEEFLREFGSLRSEDEVQKLQALLKPMMLRRLKDDVEKSLAPKEETIVEVELTNIQKKYYRGIMEQNFSFLQKGTTSANIPNLMNTMMELRKCCIHPYLLNGAEEQIQYDYRQQHGEDQEAYYKNLIASSGKMVLIDKLLPKLRANGHRVLVFSQMVRCLDILEDYLIYRKYPYERIDGRIRGNLRQAAIDRYSKPDSDRFVFLLCTKAGGLGINLTAADTVIIYDSDWNPQNDLQAQARCHRIGQQKMVKIYRLLCRNTYEREMFDKASLKLGLDKAILQSMNTGQPGKDGTNNKQLSKKEVEDLLKKGAYGAIMDDESECDKFCEEDIDSILLRRTQIITMESEKGSTFSKASFASSNNRSDINIDDPDFWNKWAKRAEIDPNACERDDSEDLILAEPRRRTQIKRYGQEDGIEGMSEESSVQGDSDDENMGVGLRSRRRREREKAKKMKQIQEDYIPRDRDTLAALGFDEVSYGSWARSECFKVEKGLLSYGWGRWTEILEVGQFKRGWREQDVEDCARIILLFCLVKYQGDEKIKSFIWELIAPVKEGEELNISRSHSGLHNLVPRGRNAKGRKGKGTSSEDNSPKPTGCSSKSSMSKEDNPLLDENHWSKDDKYDAESFLEPPYKKHLTRHANKVLLRVRMLYYIRHEVIGEFTQQIHDGLNYSEIPIRPPPTNDQVPVSWWNPNCCDRSLLIGTYKHGCENYRQIRADPKLCFMHHCGPGDGTDEVGLQKEVDEDNNSKQGDDDVEEDLQTDARSASVVSKDNVDPDRPSSSGIDDEEKDLSMQLQQQQQQLQQQTQLATPEDAHYWPTMQDLNTRLRRVITAYQRNYKKEELKQQQKQKLQPIVTPAQLGLTPSSAGGGGASSSSSNASTPVPGSSGGGSGTMHYGTGGASNNPNSNLSGSMPSPNDLSLMLSLGLGLNPADASQLANIDLTKLAQYLKMERREKIEQVVRERERVRFEQIHKKWQRKEENEFLRVLTGYGIDLVPNASIPSPDWSRFKAFAKLDKKSDEQMSDYYKVFIAMCKRQAGVKLLEEEKNLEGYIDEISEDHAKLVLDRLDLLSKLREIVRHPKLDERIKLCEKNLDTPDWWEPGKHDRELIRAVLKHGLYKSDQFILNDPEFSFFEAEKKYIRDLEARIQRVVKAEKEKAAIVAEVQKEETQPEVEIIKTEKSTEKVEVETKEESKPEPEKKEEEPKDLKVEEEKPEPMEVDEEAPAPKVDEKEEKIDEEKEEAKETKETVDEETPEAEAEKVETETETKADVPEEPEVKELEKEEPMEVDEKVEEKEEIKEEVKPEETAPEIKVPEVKEPETPEVVEVPEKKEKIDDPSKQAAELKARYPDLEVFQPLMKLKELDSLLKNDKSKPFTSFLDTTMVVKWFRDFALEKRIGHIVYCIDNNDWPVGKSYSAYTGCLGIDLDAPLYETIKRVILVEVEPRRSAASTPDIITITTDHQNLSKQLSEAAALRSSMLSSQALSQSMAAVAAAPGRKGKGKRHIAIDVETERAKLHALLNNTQSPVGSSSSKSSIWDDVSEQNILDNRTRRSAGGGGGGNTPQPPPAHQHARSTGSGNYKSTVIPGTSSTLTPIDLSGGSFPSLPKMNIADMLKNPMDLSEVQDFSMSSKSKHNPGSGGQGKSKLNDMLSKLMKKNNVPVEEPPVTIEKKRRKLDEIVLGLSAAKESKYDTPSLTGLSSSSASKKQQITPSVSVTPASAPSSQSSSQQQQKPFTITVTSVPGTSKGQNQSSGGNNSSSSSASATSLAALQSMTGITGLSQKDALAATMFFQQDQLKQYQKVLNQLPPNSSQRKQYEAMISELKQMADMTAKFGGFPHESKVNKWLQEQNLNAFTDQALGLDYLNRSTQRQSSSRQSSGSTSTSSSRQQRSTPSTSASPSSAAADPSAGFNWKNLTGEENVAVINKHSGKKLTGSKAPQLKRLTQWLSENPSYEIDPKWAESISRPPPPMPKPSPTETNSGSSASSSKLRNSAQQQSSSSSRDYQQPSTSKSSKSSSMSQYAGLSGLHPLSGLPGLGSFDPKNPLMMSFAGMPGLSGMGGMQNLNNMSLFANLAGLSSLPGMDAQSLAAMMQAAGFDPTGAATMAATGGSSTTPSKQNSSGNSTSKSRKSDMSQQQQSSSATSSANSSSKVPTSSASSSSMGANSPFSFLFPNPSLLYTPLGLGGLNPYSLPGGMSAYDQLAQQCQLLNGGNSMSSSQSGNKGSSGASKQSSSRQSTSASNSSSNKRSSSSRDQLQQLLLPPDTHLLESLSRTGLDVSQSRSSGRSDTEKRSAAAAQANKEAIEKLERERRKMIENIRNGIPPDFALHGLNFPGTSSPSSSSKKSSKDMPLLPPDFSQELLQQMAVAAAQMSSSSSGSSKRSRDQDIKDAFEQLTKNPVELLARSLGVGPGISLIPTSSESSKRMRADSHSSTSSRTSMDTKMQHAEELKSPRSTRSSANQEDKVTLTPVSASQIAPSLPSQTTISLAAPSKSDKEERKDEDKPQKSAAEDLSQQRVEKPNHEIDIEDMIAPVKVSKESGVVMAEEQRNQIEPQIHDESKEEQHQAESSSSSSKDHSRKKSGEDTNSDGRSAGEEHQGEDSEERRGRRTRSKRARTDDFEPQPERRRELRSSAGRLAAAAARRMAAEKAAAEQEASLNLTKDSSDKGDEST